MPPRRRQRLGPAIDVSAMARGLAIPGGDTRHWISYGTVASIVDDNGNADITDPNVLVIAPSGIDVDVVLEPSGYQVTCRHGIETGTVFICGPIKPGDQVVCGIPDGDVSMIPQILKVISGAAGAADAIPTGEDGKPVFKNDRLLVFARGVPIDLRTDAGANLLLNPDGSVALTAGGGKNTTLNGGSKGVARAGDPLKLTFGTADLAAIAGSLVGANLVGPPTGSPTPAEPVKITNSDETGDYEIASGSNTVLAGD